MFDSLRHWQQALRFGNGPELNRQIVFYAETTASWVHLSPVLRSLIEDHGIRPSCLVSHGGKPADVGLSDDLPFFPIGDGLARTFTFSALNAKILVSTTPDLQTLHLKRSKNPVHYVYLHHSIVSTHMIYRPGAFDHFDAVLCVGPHHVAEIRETEKLGNLPPKQLVEHGYGRLDSLMKSAGVGTVSSDESTRVLVAPSWGSSGLFETCGSNLIEGLLAAGFQVTARPHPETRKRTPAALDALRARFNGHPKFSYEENVASQSSLHSSHVMISDWSGAALEFAFAFEKPVIFVDLPRKVNNPDYQRLSMEPIEVYIRGRIGKIASATDTGLITSLIEEMRSSPNAYREQIRSARAESIFNLGCSGIAGASYLARLLQDPAQVSKVRP